MRRTLFLFINVIILNCGHAQEATINALTNVPSGASTVLFDNLHVFPPKTQLAIACVKKGKIDFFGIIRRNDSLISISNQDSIFEIGSITKVFTNTLLANYLLRGTIKPNDPVNKYFPFPFKNNPSISFVSLANHSSGLPRLPTNFLPLGVNPYLTYDTAKLNAYLQNNLVLSDNKVYAYSNLGTGLLGYTLSQLSGKKVQDMMKEDIFKPLGMTNSYTSRHDIKNGLVPGRDASGKITSNWDFDALFPAGGILSSTRDMSRFIVANFDTSQKALQLTHKPTLTVNENLRLGLGWHIGQIDGDDIWWHNGGTGGYRSALFIDPASQSGVIILSNISAFHPQAENVDVLCGELLKLIKK